MKTMAEPHPLPNHPTEGERAQNCAFVMRQVGRGLRGVYPVEEDGRAQSGLKDALTRCLQKIEAAQAGRR